MSATWRDFNCAVSDGPQLSNAPFESSTLNELHSVANDGNSASEIDQKQKKTSKSCHSRESKERFEQEIILSQNVYGLPSTTRKKLLWFVWHSLRESRPPNDNGRVTLSLIRSTALTTPNNEQKHRHNSSSCNAAHRTVHPDRTTIRKSFTQTDSRPHTANAIVGIFGCKVTETPNWFFGLFDPLHTQLAENNKQTHRPFHPVWCRGLHLNRPFINTRKGTRRTSTKGIGLPWNLQEFLEHFFLRSEVERSKSTNLNYRCRISITQKLETRVQCTHNLHGKRAHAETMQCTPRQHCSTLYTIARTTSLGNASRQCGHSALMADTKTSGTRTVAKISAARNKRCVSRVLSKIGPNDQTSSPDGPLATPLRAGPTPHHASANHVTDFMTACSFCNPAAPNHFFSPNESATTTPGN